jgi:quinol monooxygenase YgiN
MQLLAGKFKAKPERIKDIVELARSMFSPSRAEAGCITYNFYEDRGAENSFLFFEEWKSQEAIDEHFQTPHFKQFMEKFQDMIQGQPEIKIYEVKDIKVL